MNTSTSIFIFIAMSLLSSSMRLHAQPHDHAAEHAHVEHGDAGLSLNNGKPWDTDAALRRGMIEIRTAVDLLEPAFAAEQLNQTQAIQLSEAVKGSVTTMIEQCELEPAADANLHSILAMFLAAASELEFSPLSSNGLPALQAALQAYGQYFDHVGWQSDEHAAHSH